MKKLRLDPNLIMGPIDAKNADEALIKIAENLVSLDYVKKSYPKAVVERERQFPTGLPANNGTGVAIPHCSANHILKPGIAVATLSKPIKFGVMGSKDDTVLVNIVFMLAIDEPSSQIDTLRQISLMVRDSGMLNNLKAASGREEVMRILQKVFE